MNIRLYYIQLNPCGGLCQGNHPHVAIDFTDEREEFDGEYVVVKKLQAPRYWVRGQDRDAGIHTCGLEFSAWFDTEQDALKYATQRVCAPKRTTLS